MLDNTSQLLLRHSVLQATTWLVNAQDNLGQQHQLSSHFYYFDKYARFAQPKDTFAAELPIRSQPVVLYVPKEKPLFWMILANLAACLAAGVPLYLVGSNRGGIKSLVKSLPDAWQPALKVASGNHCVLFQTQRTETPVSAFSLADYATDYPLAVPGAATPMHVANLPGVFSDQKLDQGTAVLLEYLATQQRPKTLSRVLDFACGSGVIGGFIRAYFAPTELIACDISAMALHCAEHTLASQALASSYQVLASDGLTEVRGHFDWIISNPPFHAGQQTDYSIAEQFFEAAAKQLTRNGRLTIVANSFLGYNERLERHFRTVNEVINTRKYKVIEAYDPY